MAQLFKNKTLKAELKDYRVPDFDKKLAIVQSWYEAYKNGSLHAKTETQCEQAFNQSFFMEVLGYKSFPNETYTIDPKASTETGGQKPDAILGYFSPETKRVVAVVEIKDVNTSLSKSQQREGNLSPIQQAFKYKPQFKECSFVIATNFFELRLHKDNQLDFEQFTLEDLLRSDDDYFIFKKFYYLLNAENFVAEKGLTNTEKILAEIRIEEEKISKSFYKDYRKLRQELIQNINKNKKLQRDDFPLAIEKAQKIIDRVVFICFCEDLGLIPENKLQEVVYYADKLGLAMPIWDILKGFFTAIDRGSDKLQIRNGFNGELFKEDVELNNLIIDDEICKKFTEFGKYDFEEDLSVNILGRIFEQSISDIEELKTAESIDEMSEKISKRKKDGIFYTPDYIVDYIVQTTLGRYLQEIENEILAKHKLKIGIKDQNYEKRLRNAYLEYWDRLKNVKVLDPACGSGAFLVKVFDYLLHENQRVGDILGLNNGVADFTNVYKSILQKNIYGADLNPESVEITKLSLWLKTANKGEKLVTLKENIKCGNSLISDFSIDDSAFDWNAEFSHILAAGGFDVIVGNPPYVRIQNISETASNYLFENYESATGKVDISVLFFEKALSLLNEKGVCGFISSSQWLKTGYGKGLRRLLSSNKNVSSIIDFGSLPVFEDASTYPAIVIFSKKQSENFGYTLISKLGDFVADAMDSKSIDINSLSEKEWQFGLFDLNKILAERKVEFSTLEDLGGVFIGDLTGMDEAFVVDKETMTTAHLEKEILFPYAYRGEEVEGFSSVNPNSWVIYPYEFVNDKTVLLQPEIFKNNYPNTWNYLERFIGKLKQRKDSRKLYAAGENWYRHLRPGVFQYLLPEKVIFKGIGTTLEAGLLGQRIAFNGANCPCFVPNDKNTDLWTILGIVNSKLISYYLSEICPAKLNNYYRYNATSLAKVPICITNDSQIANFAKAISNLRESIGHKRDNFLNTIVSEYKLSHVTRKLFSFYELEPESFLKEINVQLSLNQKSEILEFFSKNQSSLLSLVNESSGLMAKLDDAVFDLYQISDVERAAILKKLQS